MPGSPEAVRRVLETDMKSREFQAQNLQFYKGAGNGDHLTSLLYTVRPSVITSLAHKAKNTTNKSTKPKKTDHDRTGSRDEVKSSDEKVTSDQEEFLLRPIKKKFRQLKQSV